MHSLSILSILYTILIFFWKAIHVLKVFYSCLITVRSIGGTFKPKGSSKLAQLISYGANTCVRHHGNSFKSCWDIPPRTSDFNLMVELEESWGHRDSRDANVVINIQHKKYSKGRLWFCCIYSCTTTLNLQCDSFDLNRKIAAVFFKLHFAFSILYFYFNFGL